MDKTRVGETQENILNKIAAMFALARTYDLLAQYDETAYQDGEYDES